MNRRDLLMRGLLALLGIGAMAVRVRAMPPLQEDDPAKMSQSTAGIKKRDDFFYSTARRNFGKAEADHLAKSFNWEVSDALRAQIGD